MYSELEKIKAKKEKKVKEYYKAFLGGSGLDTIAIHSLKDKKFTKKRKLISNPHKNTHKQIRPVNLPNKSGKDTVCTGLATQCNATVSTQNSQPPE